MKHHCLLTLLIGCLFALSSTHAQIEPPGGIGGGTPQPSPPPEGLGPERTLIDLEIAHIGTLRLALFDRDKPVTVRNFLDYLYSGAYSNSFMHRSAGGFVVQGGSLRLADFGGGSQAIVPVEESTPITNELAVGRFFSNTRGTLTLAHENGLTNAATCHWFINLADNPWLDASDTNHSYVVFGRVVSGLELLDKLDPTHANSQVSILNFGGWLEELPVRQGVAAQSVAYGDLLTTFYRVVALDVPMQISPASGGGMTISWQSRSNRAHTVEWTADLGAPSWQLLWTTNGNGSVQSVVDASPPGMRFYRVKHQ